MQESINILIVDSDRDQVEMLMSWLKTLGHEVHRAYTEEQARVEWEKHEPDLIIIDPLLDQANGLGLCREMQQKHDALVLVLTYSTSVHDEIKCLQAGADAFLRKPFLPAQLLAHLYALSRRLRSTLHQRPSSIISVGPIKVDALHNEAVVFDRVVRLTRTEAKLLHFLAANVNNVCTYEQIVSHIWGLGYEGDTSLIKAHIRHLRQKIELDPTRPCYILTVPGVGYTLKRTPIKLWRSDNDVSLRAL
ncbi:MAG TPA: response regulator transcription factor [Ktedonobacteraceae bacterium]|jgi:DNA-binding response OmpR family regulator|nr:response regulator transcription factor [Ktedonobacteraceae bacterium]